MKALILAGAIALAMSGLSGAPAGSQTPPAAPAPATAATPAAAPAPVKKPPTAAQLKQRQKMRDCSASAKKQSLAGDARRKFMSTCLKSTGTPKVPTTRAG